MAVELVDYVASLKREVQPPGTDLFSGVTESAWVGYLSDAFWEARLDGFLQGYEALENGPGDVSVVPVNTGGQDMPRQDIALIVLYAGVRILRNRILNMSTTFRAKAGPVEFEQQNSAIMLREMLQQLKATKDRIILTLDEGELTHTLVLDNYSTRVFDLASGYTARPELAG